MLIKKMEMYQLKIERKAIKALARMPRKDAERMLGALDRLAENPDRRDIDDSFDQPPRLPFESRQLSGNLRTRR